MVSCRNIISGLGAVVVAAGAATLSITSFRTATDTTIAKAASACLKMQSALDTATGSSTLSKVGSILKTGARFALPKGISLAEDAATSICESAIRINAYSMHIAVGTGLIAVGALVFGLSRCFTVKCKQE